MTDVNDIATFTLFPAFAHSPVFILFKTNFTFLKASDFQSTFCSIMHVYALITN